MAKQIKFKIETHAVDDQSKWDVRIVTARNYAEAKKKADKLAMSLGNWVVESVTEKGEDDDE